MTKGLAILCKIFSTVMPPTSRLCFLQAAVVRTHSVHPVKNVYLLTCVLLQEWKQLFIDSLSS